MAVKACLNGARTRDEHAAVPLSADELARDARAAQQAGAFAVHVHPRDRDGRQTLKQRDCDAAVAAIRKAAPRLPIGLSSAEMIDPDPFARAAAIRAWKTPPDFISVNVWEVGWAGIMRAAGHAGIAVEAGVSTVEEAQELIASPFSHQLLRVLVEVEGGADEARAVAAALPSGVKQLWHGFEERTWEVIPAAIAAGSDVRVGLEDVLTLPDGTVAESNAQLVAAVVTMHGGQAS